MSVLLLQTMLQNGAVMAGKVRHLVNRSGRYFARLVVPKELRDKVGKTELRTPLGGDYRQALKLLPSAVAQLQHEIAAAERKTNTAKGIPEARYPLAPDQIALSHYHQRLAFDDTLRNDPRYAAVTIDDTYVMRLRDGMAGRLSDADLVQIVGPHIERFRASGNMAAATGTDEWRTVARALCAGEYEALSRVAERDGGDFTGRPSHPVIANAKLPEDAKEPVRLTKLWADYVAARKGAGFMRDGGTRQTPVIASLRKFLKHDDAARITRKDVMAWRDELMKTLSAKTVNDVYLSTVRSLFSWANENERLTENPAATVKQRKPKKVYSRERGFTDAEALAVLKVSRGYEPPADEFGRVRETPQLTAAKRWVPLLSAFSGARVSEMTQLRVEDIRCEGDVHVMRITPEAGTVKAGGYRDVPLHPQIIAEGFLEFVKEIGQGPLFHNGRDPAKYAAKAKRIANQIADWLRVREIVPEGVQPTHGWRHRFKTLGRELEISERVVDAIQGHASRISGDNYGDVTLKIRVNAINRLPAYALHEAA